MFVRGWSDSSHRLGVWCHCSSQKWHLCLAAPIGMLWGSVSVGKISGSPQTENRFLLSVLCFQHNWSHQVLCADGQEFAPHQTWNVRSMVCTEDVSAGLASDVGSEPLLWTSPHSSGCDGSVLPLRTAWGDSWSVSYDEPSVLLDSQKRVLHFR